MTTVDDRTVPLSVHGGSPLITYSKASSKGSQEMSHLRVLCRDHPRRSIALATDECVLELTQPGPDYGHGPVEQQQQADRHMLEAFFRSSKDLQDYRLLGEGSGTLGLISFDQDIFICVVSSSSRAATVRPGETILKIENVEFCLSSESYSS